MILIIFNPEFSFTNSPFKKRIHSFEFDLNNILETLALNGFHHDDGRHDGSSGLIPVNSWFAGSDLSRFPAKTPFSSQLARYADLSQKSSSILLNQGLQKSSSILLNQGLQKSSSILFNQDSQVWVWVRRFSQMIRQDWARSRSQWMFHREDWRVWKVKH